MEPKGPEWLGLELIQASGMKRKGKNALSSRWRGVGVLVRRGGGVGAGRHRRRCCRLAAP